MAVSIDPQGVETSLLFDFAGDLSGKRILEVGSGDGRLVERYASKALSVVGIDPDEKKVQRAVHKLPPELRERVAYHCINLEQFSAQRAGQHSPEKFDLAILAWSL